MSNHLPFEVFILGSNSALPVAGKHPTAQFLKHEHQYFLLDCGEGTQFLLNEYQLPKSKVRQIFITHMHGDHFFGLPGLLTTYKLSGRINPLTIYSPPGLKKAIESFIDLSSDNLSFPVEFVEIPEAEQIVIFENENLKVETLHMLHRIPCHGYLFSEKEGKRKIIKEKIEGLDLPVEVFPKLQKGKDVTLQDGTVLRNEEFTIEAPPPRKYAFFGDTKVNNDLIDKVADAELLYHEATFGAEESQMAEERYHSTISQAAEFAKKARVKKLLIGHVSTRYPDITSLLNDGKKIFPDIQYAEEGKWFEV